MTKSRCIRISKKCLIWLLVLLIAMSATYVLLKVVPRRIYPMQYADIVTEMAAEYDLAPSLVLAVIHTESKFDQNALSSADAKGLMQITDDYLCLSMEIIKDLTPPEPAEDGTVLTGCGIDHDHVFYSERITTQPVMEETDRTDGESNTGVVYRSGENKTSALSALLWASYDNGDGSCTEADGMGIRGVLPGPEELREVNIPVLYTYPNGTMEAIVPVNGQITEVYLLDMTDRENYPMTEITWEEMEALSPGEYYIVTRVLRSGNCDPGVPQNSRCYEELFCLVVQERSNNQNRAVF